MRVIYGSEATPEKQEINRALGDFASRRIWGEGRGFGPFGSIGVVDDTGTVIASFIYHNWDIHAGVIEISGAADTQRWGKRHIIHEMFAIPFDQFGCQMVVLRVYPENQTPGGRGLVRLLKAYGFKEYLIPRLGGRHQDQILFTLTDNDWRSSRFQKGKYDGQIGSNAS